MVIQSSDFGVSDKATSPPIVVDSDGVGLGLKLQSTESFPKTTTMMHHRPSSSSTHTDTKGDYGSGPTCNNGANEVVWCRSMSNIYHDDRSIVVVVPAAAAAAPAPHPSVRTTLPPFDIFTSASTTSAFKSSEGLGMAATFGVPFTSAQWKELERQAMIYKYMAASVPVPYDLLLPIAPNHLSAGSATHPAYTVVGNGGSTSIFNQLRYSSKQDPEPGRCKRTDGKKWRCSRDVAPHQKYCERHMHRGRPRSRKHVEVQNQNPPPFNKKTRLENNTPLPNPPTTLLSNRKVFGSTMLPNETSPSLLDTKNVDHIFASYKEPNRGLDWKMEGEMVRMDASEQQWLHLMHTTGGSIYNPNHSVFQQDFGEASLNLYSYADFSASHDFLGSDFVSVEKQPQIGTPRGFIDAWSTDNINLENKNNKDSSVSSNGNLSPSSLTLSMTMAVGNYLDEEMGQIQMGLGFPDANPQKPAQVSSLLSPVSWLASTPGGPLAEVLRPSNVAIGSNPASPYAGSGDSISPRATTVSSPSGVLQRTMLSVSDSSVCNSPTIVASTATPDMVAFRWST